MPIGLKGNSDGSGAIQIGGSDAISISTGLNTTFAGTITATGTVAGTTGTLYPLVSGTAVTASGTAVDFTGIPSWVRRVTVMLNSVSTNGTSIPLVQLGTSSGIATTGYTGHAAAINGGTGQTSSTSGHIINNGSSAAAAYAGHIVFTNINTNNWVGSAVILNSLAAGAMSMSASLVGLSGTLDRVRITTVNGTDAFDAGVINVFWE